MHEDQMKPEMQGEKKIWENPKLIIYSLLFGIVGFFCVIEPVELVLGWFRQQFSGFLLAYNPVLSGIEIYQNIALILICSLLIGFLNGRFFHSVLWKSRADAIASGFFSGIGSITVMLIFLIFHQFEFFAGFGLYPFGLYFGNLQNLFTLINAVVLIACVCMLQIYGISLYHESKLNTSEQPGKTQKSLKNYLISKFYPTCIVVILILLIMPYCLIFAGIRAGVIERETPVYLGKDTYSVTKLNDTAIEITQTTEKDITSRYSLAHWVIPDMKKPSARIFISLPCTQKYVYDKYYQLVETRNTCTEVSDQKIIHSQNINITISPPEGLEYGNNSKVILNSQDNEVPCDTFVVEILPRQNTSNAIVFGRPSSQTSQSYCDIRV